MTGLVIIGVIPARFRSSRFPGKPLVIIENKPMIQWVYQNANKSKLISDLYVATDDIRIYNTVNNFGGKAIMTSAKHKSGTDRIEEAIRNMRTDIVVNIQGDEPFISGKNIDIAIQPLIEDKRLNVSTLATKFLNEDELYDRNKVKVIFANNNDALYFSRAVIPFKDTNNKLFLQTTKVNRFKKQNLSNYYKHIGLYVFRTKFLKKFAYMKQSRLEKSEHLEQLRILEGGEKIRVVIINKDSKSVDTPEDLINIIKEFKRR